MPVYDGAAFIVQAIDSILAQTYRDFELILSDNASTDGTEGICRYYAARDTRLRYYRNPQNIGPARNHNQVVALANGMYFMWMSHDDLLAPEYVGRCVEVLERDAGVVLCYARAKDVDEHGEGVENPHRQNAVPEERLATSSCIPHVRFRDLIRMNHQCGAMYGLMRADALKSTAMHGTYADADRVLLAELGLRGRFHLLEERLFVHREHPGRSVNRYPSRHDRSVWMASGNAGRILLPHVRECVELLKCINRVSLTWQDRLACRVHMMRWVVRYRSRFSRDLRVAAREVVSRLLHFARVQWVDRLP